MPILWLDQKTCARVGQNDCFFGPPIAQIDINLPVDSHQGLPSMPMTMPPAELTRCSVDPVTPHHLERQHSFLYGQCSADVAEGWE